MRVIGDENEPIFEILGFRFSHAAFVNVRILLDANNGQTVVVQGMGGELTEDSPDADFINYSMNVCFWGGPQGRRVWANLRRYNPNNLANLLREWLLFARNAPVGEGIKQGIQIAGLNVSFASKHLRLLAPHRYAVLDNVIVEGIGVAGNLKGYQLFLQHLTALRDAMDCTLPIADIEAAVFFLVRQQVRAN